MKSVSKFMYFLCTTFTVIGFWVYFGYKQDYLDEVGSKAGVQFDRIVLFGPPATTFFILALMCAIIATGLWIADTIDNGNLKILDKLNSTKADGMPEKAIESRVKAKPEFYDGVDNEALQKYFAHKKDNAN